MVIAPISFVRWFPDFTNSSILRGWHPTLTLSLLKLLNVAVSSTPIASYLVPLACGTPFLIPVSLIAIISNYSNVMSIDISSCLDLPPILLFILSAIIPICSCSKCSITPCATHQSFLSVLIGQCFSLSPIFSSADLLSFSVSTLFSFSASKLSALFFPFSIQFLNFSFAFCSYFLLSFLSSLLFLSSIFNLITFTFLYLSPITFTLLTFVPHFVHFPRFPHYFHFPNFCSCLLSLSSILIPVTFTFLFCSLLLSLSSILILHHFIFFSFIPCYFHFPFFVLYYFPFPFFCSSLLSLSSFFSMLHSLSSLLFLVIFTFLSCSLLLSLSILILITFTFLSFDYHSFHYFLIFIPLFAFSLQICSLILPYVLSINFKLLFFLSLFLLIFLSVLMFFFLVSFYFSFFYFFFLPLLVLLLSLSPITCFVLTFAFSQPSFSFLMPVGERDTTLSLSQLPSLSQTSTTTPSPTSQIHTSIQFYIFSSHSNLLSLSKLFIFHTNLSSLNSLPPSFHTHHLSFLSTHFLLSIYLSGSLSLSPLPTKPTNQRMDGQANGPTSHPHPTDPMWETL
ncbi:unnamed protein product [Acanthosepion pharaonis]|uniref:Uncharacterized protein n=1 Tax=Acanthosepion pharaonis TaxID=158019 RepID=A0A812BXW2_ACAPH|nr:unnamed protein product [Sepia pharaonis]